MNILISVGLLAFAGVFKVGDATVTWVTPASGDGTVSVAENSAAGAAVETIAATSDDTLGVFTLVTAGSPFTLASTGELTVTAANTLDHEGTATYTLSITAEDASTTATATLTVSVTDVTDAPLFGSATYTQCMTDGAASGTSVKTVTASDQGSGRTLTHSFNSGNTNTDFAIDSTSGAITVANGKTLSTTTASYTLVIHAVESGANAQTGSTTVTVTVAATCNSAAALGISITAILMIMLVTIL